MVSKTQGITTLTNLFATQAEAEQLVSSIDFSKINHMSIIPLEDGAKDGSMVLCFLHKRDKKLYESETFIRISINDNWSIFNRAALNHDVLRASDSLNADDVGNKLMQQILKKVKKNAVKFMPHFNHIVATIKQMKQLDADTKVGA